MGDKPKALITIALQLVRDHYEDNESQFAKSCIELEKWCYDNDKPELAEYACAQRCPAVAFIPM